MSVDGEMLGVAGRNLTFGLDSGNFTIAGQKAKLLVDLADTHNTMNTVAFKGVVNYDCEVGKPLLLEESLRVWNYPCI